MNPGNHIGQYKILRKLGAGGMGTVYLAEHVLLGRRAAIKTLLPALSVHKEIVDRFFNEARATSAIADPGVVQVFDFGYHVDGTAYIVLELLEGEALADRMQRLGVLPQVDALKIARQVASALAAAHERGIVHRDLKPENLYLVRDAEAQGGERTKLLDFGICKLEGDDKLTQSGTTLGTPLYMSPEQCRGSGGVDHRSDIYALGCVLFHMLTGRTPFECEGAGEYIVAHLQQEAPAVSTIQAGLHPLIDVLLIRCLAKDPDERFQTMGELQDAIGQVMAKLSAPGIASALPVGSPVLGQGFQSGSGTEAPPAVGWFESKPTLGTTTGAPSQAIAVRSWPRRIAFAAITAAALVTALFATRAALGTGTAEAEATSGAVGSSIASETGAPDAATMPAPSPVPAPSLSPDASTSTSTSTSTIAEAPTAAVPEPTRSIAPPRKRASRRARVTTPEPIHRDPPKLPAPTNPTEDLYDTR